MVKDGCPFCGFEDPVLENELAIAIPDKFPVRPGHTLVIPKRHVSSYFDLTDDELLACYDLVKKAKEMIDRDHSPGGYRVGANIGRAANQTVMHVHIHVLPMGGATLDGREEVSFRR